MRVLLFAVLAACGAKPVLPPPVVTAGSGSAVAVSIPVEESDTSRDVEPEADLPGHPWSADSLARLPKVDFATPYAKTADAAKAKQAGALHADAVALHSAKDWTGAEQKYTAALAIDPGHVEARYGLASVLVRLGKADRALALLLELRRAACNACMAAVNRARWDDDWEPVWDRVAFASIGYRSLSTAWAETATCAPGLEPAKTWADDFEFACTRNGKLHGRYARTGFGADWGGHGNSEEVGEYRDGKKHGLWLLSHMNGATEVSSSEFGAYVDDVRHGLWVASDADRAGAHSVHDKLVNGLRQGTTRKRSFTVYREDETPLLVDNGTEELTYAKDVLHGPARTWAGNGVSQQGSYQQGKKHGKWIESADGKVINETEYVDGEKHGSWTLRTQSGDKTYTGTWDRGRPTGVHEYWHAGKLVGKATITNFTGDWVAYEDNVLVEKGRIVDGKRQGKWSFKERGNWHVGTYAGGRRTGTWTKSDFSSKAKEAEGPYVDDKQHGAWTFWRDGKQLRAKGRFVKGVVDGEWTIFEDNKPVQKVLVKAGALVEVDGESATEIHKTNFTGAWAEYPDKIAAEESPFGM